MESTHGSYDKLCTPLNPFCPQNKSILPMNIYVTYWKKLGYTRDQLLNTEINIDAGCLILSRIWKRVKDPTIRKVASVYQILGTVKVTDYGARVQKIYDEKPWDTK